MEQARSIWGGVTSVVGAAVRSWFAMLGLALALGIALAIAAYLVLAGHGGYALLMVVVILFEAAAVGIFGGFQRALASALAQAVKTTQIGSRVIRTIFTAEFGLGIDQGGNRLARSIERIPLAQAEQALARGASNLLRGDENARGLTGKLRRGIQAKVLEGVQGVTLARFREEGARGPEGTPGVDLRKVQADLEGRMDEYLIDRFGGGAAFATGLLLGGLAIVAIAETALVKYMVE